MYWLKRLRRKTCLRTEFSKNIPQGPKPGLYLAIAAVRVKALAYQSCPDTSSNPDRVFPQPVRAVPFTFRLNLDAFALQDQSTSSAKQHLRVHN
jgi:hypothetical protein